MNPARLAPRARDSICEQCHLSGEVRVLNPGRQWQDFRPGQELEEVFSVYVRDPNTATERSGIKVVSHAEQLALSRCARTSQGKLWCGTCHDPHSETKPSTASYRERCLGCHGEALLKTHSRPADNCVGCHMQKHEAKDGAHTVFTDHRISRKPAAQPNTDVPVEKLIAWHEPDGAVALRNLGLANIEVGERQHSAALLEEGAAQVVEAMKSLPPEPVMLGRVGLLLLRKGETADATEVLEFALQLDPTRAGSHVNLGNAYAQAGQVDKAVSEFERAIELDPSLQSAYRSLADVYRRAEQPDAARTVLERYLTFMPQSLTAQQATSASGGR